MLSRALILIALTLPATLSAQSPATKEPRDGVMLAFENFAIIFGGRLIAAFDSIPAARYDYRPTRAQQTIGIEIGSDRAAPVTCASVSGR